MNKLLYALMLISSPLIANVVGSAAEQGKKESDQWQNIIFGIGAGVAAVAGLLITSIDSGQNH